MVPNASLVLLYPTLLTSLLKQNFSVFPNGDGMPQLIQLDDTPLSLEQQLTLAADAKLITFTLYTRNNPKTGQPLLVNDVNSIRKSNWNETKQTIIVAHGWNSDGKQAICTLIRDAFIKVEDLNVIIVDWSAIAKNPLYNVVAKSVPSVADYVATLVNFLRAKAGLQTSKLKIIGHSLGAHVAGLSARSVSKSSQVAEVIGLDPAKPLFEHKGPGGRVDKTDAKNVQVVHTCPGLLGLDYSVGTSDFFANDGRKQPGCTNDLLGSCAHERSYEYYSESITNPKGFVGVSQKDGSKAYMGGANLDPRAKGTYNFKTAAQPPFALGG